MPTFCYFALPTAAMLLLPGLAGCVTDSEGRDQSSKATAAAETRTEAPSSTPKIVADLPELPLGAGPMDSDAPDEFTRTKSGLYYRILRKSKGRKPHSVDRILAHYKGWLNNGNQFDNSYDRGEPSEFTLNKVVPGWTEGLQLIGVGGMIELEVPPKLGYGMQPPRGIPPNSTLHFLIELKEIR